MYERVNFDFDQILIPETYSKPVRQHFCKNSSMTAPKGLTRLVFTAKTFRSLQKLFFEYGPD